MIKTKMGVWRRRQLLERESAPRKQGKNNIGAIICNCIQERLFISVKTAPPLSEWRAIKRDRIMFITRTSVISRSKVYTLCLPTTLRICFLPSPALTKTALHAIYPRLLSLHMAIMIANIRQFDIYLKVIILHRSFFPLCFLRLIT